MSTIHKIFCENFPDDLPFLERLKLKLTDANIVVYDIQHKPC